MSSWGWGNKISKLEQVGDFSIFGSKLIIFSNDFKKILNCQNLMKDGELGYDF